MTNKQVREYRTMVLRALDPDEEAPETEEKRVTGYASTFNEPYTLYEDDWIIYREQVAPEAFDNADMTDVIMQYDHQGRVFARISNGTLEVATDDKGLLIDADLGGTELGRQLYDEIRGGYTDKMSFGFTVEQDEELRTKGEDGREEYLRTITGIAKLYDVSAVSIPANDGTTIGVSTRSKIDGAIEDARAERLAAEEMELERRRVEIRAKAIKSGGNK